ncbi:hypothetical protein K431DRAFT_283736 [Polychaeton citri CBS 116435]|uniref:Uncharacterized protein n=1 Tax=Polychaeton citri CBS 116435 TaxID=1314669 RepID=A0A9P4Q8L4_9PEZI|nr:hypothetical protein K431DRAFT_283736 [Polychaeton citri CBS 116435]
MPLHNHYTLPKDDQQQTVDASWFDTQQKRWSRANEAIHGFLTEEMKALQAFHDGKATAEETAHAITRPISTSPVPSLGTYSDESVAIADLWRLLMTALMEWPSCRTPDLLELLSAIGKVPDKVHSGEATNDTGEEQLEWSTYPYIGMVWYGANELEPGQIVKQSPDAATLETARTIYLRQREIDAQLIARGVYSWRKQIVQYIIKTLEKKPDPNDRLPAPDEATAYDQVRLEFQIPGVSSWFRHNGQDIFNDVVRDELKDWRKKDMPKHAVHFERGIDRWTFWEKRLSEISRDEADDGVRAAADAALECMRNVDTSRT